ncbi:hypothetical protein AVEN_81274-2 [Araneus ventricosus]|uniref:Uncharacterized protein n=1 Tax=Araneus ventricosus TaxID=182803 RepID=A0A4Y2LV10_ARAVE|nr:hypothetical protein AVEN_81274-2 [Araneus ventricosus]
MGSFRLISLGSILNRLTSVAVVNKCISGRNRYTRKEKKGILDYGNENEDLKELQKILEKALSCRLQDDATSGYGPFGVGNHHCICKSWNEMPRRATSSP